MGWAKRERKAARWGLVGREAGTAEEGKRALRVCRSHEECVASFQMAEER
jgi:hypothetical protein